MRQQLRLKIENHNSVQEWIWKSGYNFETKSKLLEEWGEKAGRLRKEWLKHLLETNQNN